MVGLWMKGSRGEVVLGLRFREKDVDVRYDG